MADLTLVIGNKNYSSWSLRGWYLLRQAEIPFEEIRLSLDTAEFRKQVVRYSPAGRVPLLLSPEGAIWDSLAIAEYVAESFPDKKLWPDCVIRRAFARSMCAEMHAGFPVLRACLPMNCRAHARSVVGDEALGADIDRVLDLWHDCLEKSHGPWLFGDFSVADAMFAPVISRFVTYQIPLDGAIADYSNTVMDSVAMREWVSAAEAESEVLPREEVGQQDSN